MARNPFTIRLFRQQHGRCYLCGGRMTLDEGLPNTATQDHALPLSRFKKARRLSNIRAACLLCNNRKGALTDWEYMLLLAARKGVKVDA
jgi:5-methylcytosine-specific restriction endonuclease McrA